MLTRCTLNLKQLQHSSSYTRTFTHSRVWRKKKRDLDVFSQFPNEDPLVNPLQHKILKTELVKSPVNSKLLKVSILGTTNSGKSTLINKLVGHHVCPESMKANTTRANARAVLTEADTQVVFLDTPGVVDSKSAARFKLDNDMILDPERSCKYADLLIVLHDVSNRYVREAVSKKILRLLALYYRHVPSVLVLNKMDTIPRSRRVYDLIRKLTCNRLDGVEGQVAISKNDSKFSMETYLKRKAREMENMSDMKEHVMRNEDSTTTSDRMSDILKVAGNDVLTEDTVHELTAGLVGWPGFRDVFTISALTGDGVNDLKQYLLASAEAGDWMFGENIKFDKDPREIVTNIVKSKLLEHLHGSVPYELKPVISMWEIDQTWDTLKIVVTVDAKNKSTFKFILGGRGAKISQISRDIQETLANFFLQNVNFKLTVVPKFTVIHNDVPNTTLKPNISI